MTTTQSLVGPKTAPPSDPKPDEPNLTNLVRRPRLVASNTWHCRRHCTYVQGEARTQIDFIFRGPHPKPREAYRTAGKGAVRARPLLSPIVRVGGLPVSIISIIALGTKWDPGVLCVLVGKA